MITAEAGSSIAAISMGVPQSADQRPLTNHEVDLLAALAPAVRTPREAKRLMNLYRMIRATRDLSPAAEFLGQDGQAGQYQAVIVLLGMVVGFSGLLDVLDAAPYPAALGGLRHRDRSSTWAQFFVGIKPTRSDGGWQNLIVGTLDEEAAPMWLEQHSALADASSLVTLDDIGAFKLWAPRVARFSFRHSSLATTAE